MGMGSTMSMGVPGHGVDHGPWVPYFVVTRFLWTQMLLKEMKKKAHLHIRRPVSSTPVKVMAHSGSHADFTDCSNTATYNRGRYQFCLAGLSSVTAQKLFYAGGKLDDEGYTLTGYRSDAVGAGVKTVVTIFTGVEDTGL